jgi:hypothetical protein
MLPARGARVPVPQFRAAVLKQHLATLPELGEAAAAAARAAAGPERIREIERTRGTEWLASRVAADMVHAVHGVAGVEAVHAFGRGVGRRGLGTAILWPLVVATRGLFGYHPVVLLQFFPRAWPVGTRNCGQLRVESHGRTWGRILHLDLPEELRAAHQLAGVAGVLEGGLVLCGASSARATVEYEPGDTRCAYALDWR